MVGLSRTNGFMELSDKAACLPKYIKIIICLNYLKVSTFSSSGIFGEIQDYHYVVITNLPILGNLAENTKFLKAVLLIILLKLKNFSHKPKT